MLQKVPCRTLLMLDDGVDEDALRMEPSIKKVIAAAADREKVPLALNVLLTGEEKIRELNRMFRGVDSVTDVLSFPSFEFTGRLAEYIAAGGEAETADGFVEAGDIAICVPRSQEQAKNLGHSTEREIMFLALHGTLHLLGYDHMTPEDEEEMTALQRSVLAQVEEAAD